ncbi:hypothetical protein ACH4OX_23985 [Streptomyces roseolus]|uniref:MmyB family transcriptional regulator n=1 Tax=Streptomyces roseolus TaxID=67358 RepID=UPI003797434F
MTRPPYGVPAGGARVRQPAPRHRPARRVRPPRRRPGPDPLGERLRAAGEESAEPWAAHEVAVRRHGRMRVEHPLTGELP